VCNASQNYLLLLGKNNNMSWVIILLLILGGLSLLIIELLVIPGTTVVGIIGFILMIVGIWQAYVVYGNFMGTMVLLATLLISIVGFYMSLRSNTWKKAGLNKSIISQVNTDSKKLKIGDIGTTTSRLNPMGKAFINDDFYEVSTYGDYLDNDQEIQVIAIEGKKILVEKADKESENKSI